MRNSNTGCSLIYMVFSVLTAMIGYTIHGSLFWSFMDFVFTPFAWIKWLIMHQVTMSVIKNTFSWFFN